MDLIAWFEDTTAKEHELVGGKGANLGRLVAAGFPVPPGFTVTTAAYADFMLETGLRDELLAAVAALDHGDADGVAAATAAIRERIVAAPTPARVDAAIRDAHARLAAQADRVAVRSSGTAEDLAEASFAGMHDTYLDIAGPDAVVDAVKRCWASLWTARATTYRSNKGFDHGEARLAVVVQAMVRSDVSGVMFTANPLTTNTDEIVINTSWGLGEAIVSGEVTPDEIALSRRTLAVRRRTTADKERQVVREQSGGTRLEPVPADRRSAPSLGDREAAAVGALGRRVMEYYDGWPQDIEWALADGELYLLQSRDVTGVDFTWDEDVDATFQRDPERNEGILWTHQWAREFWNGAISPLHYSVRGRMFEYSNNLFREVMGLDDLRAMRLFKYRRGTAYFNTEVDRRHYTYLLPRALRAAGLGNVHPDDHDATLAEPFDAKAFARILLRMQLGEPGHGVNSWLDVIYGKVEDRRGPGDTAGYGHPPEFWVRAGGLHGKTADELREVSDAELKQHTEDRMDATADYNCTLWDGFFVYAPLTLSAIGWMLANWYGDTDPSTFQSLISGLPVRTKMAEETHELWHLAQKIKASPDVTEQFERNQGEAFFAALEESDAGREFLAEYSVFAQRHGHRGHADRDFWFKRRSENRALDYEAFRANLISDDSRSPEAIEGGLIAKREETTRRIVERLKTQPLGFARAQAFELTLAYVHRFLQLRDDERWAVDIMTLSKKRCFEEISRRLLERGQLANEDDFYFLAKQDLFGMLDHGLPAGRVTRAQIEARRRAFMRALAREDDSPLYLRGDQPLPEAAVGADGVMQGTGTSRGEVTATARVVRNLEDIGRVQKGDVLICNSTDPGWASVFLIIQGLVIETGGMLAHGACLSREYGLPAVTLSGAMGLIPDGATVTVNGDTGQVTVADAADEAELEAAAGELSVA